MVFLRDTARGKKARGGGIEPPSSGSKPDGLPLADPRSRIESAMRESNPPRQLGGLEPLPLGQKHIRRKVRESNPQGLRSTRLERVAIAHWLDLPNQSSGGWTRTSGGAKRHVGLTGRSLLPTRVHRKKVRMAGFEPALSCSRSTRNTRLSYILKSKRPAGVEPALSPWQGDRLPLHHGRDKITAKLSNNRSTGRDSNPRRRITGAVSLPLDDQCLSFSGTGGHRTHIVRFKRPVHYPVCHSPVQ
jgi:hypothetical protein